MEDGQEKRIQGFQGSRVQVNLTRQKTAGKKRILNFEQGMSNYDVFSLLIFTRLICGGFYSLFDILQFYFVVLERFMMRGAL